jgi:hypothetical protein
MYSHDFSSDLVLKNFRRSWYIATEDLLATSKRINPRGRTLSALTWF